MAYADQKQLPGQLETLTNNSDILMAALVVGILIFMILPLPAFILDLLLSFNITFSIVILLVFQLIMGVRWWLAALVAAVTTLLIQQTFSGRVMRCSEEVQIGFFCQFGVEVFVLPGRRFSPGGIAQVTVCTPKLGYLPVDQ